jgi:hypothetical protein
MSLALGTSFARLNAGSASVKRMFRGSAGVWNADAADWIKRVEANSGSVSTATANAVTNFCNAIDAAGIRDKFYRLNLFCGTGLNACLVPLYRGPSLSGTQYGNTTDTNNGPFVSEDYVETGASGGLGDAANTGKYLNTGLSMNYAAPDDRHLSVYQNNAGTGNNKMAISAFSNAAPATIYELGRTTSNAFDYYSGGNFEFARQSPALAGHYVGVGSTVKSLYLDGASVDTNSAGTDVVNTSSAALFVFARNFNGNPQANLYTDARQCSYSAGLSMDSAEVLAFHNAVQGFQVALGRNV